MKQKALSFISLLLSLSLTLSLCAPAASGADLSALAAEPDNCVSMDAEPATETESPEEDASGERSVPAEPGPERDGAQADEEKDADSGAGADSASQENGEEPTASEEQALSVPQEQQSEEQKEQQKAERVTVRSAEQLSNFLAEQWSSDYFEEAVVDTRKNRVTVDGERESVKDAFGPEADKDAILDSPEAAEAYFEDTPFEAETQKDGTVVVTAPWQTCRLVVIARSLKEDYGAQTIVEYPKYHQFVLQFSDEESTRLAYKDLSQDYPCYVDEVLCADSLIQETETWGGSYMGYTSSKADGTLSDAPTIQVAVIDSGCWADNEFFQGRSFSADSKSFPDDDGPFIDTESHDSDGNPTGTHGTHVAGIIHTCTPANVELMILRILDRNSNTSLLVADTAMKYALDHGAEVINFSLGKQGYSASQDFLLDQTLSVAKEMGVPVVCSGGNRSQDVNTNYPACSPDTIAVSAINRSGTFAYTYSENPDESNLGSGGTGSSYGDGIDFCAPGVNVVSASRNSVTTKSGTSMATPHISAAFAWLCLESPSAEWSELYDRLKGLCTDLGETGKDQLYGWGCPNLSTLNAPVSGHVHQWTGAVTTPTCLSRGYTVYTCDGCNQMRIRNYNGPVHSFDENGKCTVCGKQRNSSCGESASWSYSSATETLTITGEGTVTSASWENLYPQRFIRRVSLSGVTELADGLFSDYTALESVNLGEELTVLGKNNFYGCSSLETILLPPSLTTIGDGALCACPTLEKIDCRSSDFYVADNCLLYNADKTRLIACAGAWSGGSLTVPNQVRSIGAFAFDGVGTLTELLLSTSLKQLGEGAFRNCSGLETVYARSSITEAGANAFANDTATMYVSEGCTGWEDHTALGKKLHWDSYPGDLSRWSMSLSSTIWNYTGNPRYPGIILTSGNVTVRNYKYENQEPNYKDYFTYTYANNTEPGMDTDADSAPAATVTGVGIYYGTQSQRFTISLASPVVNAPVSTENGITVSWESVFGADWYQVLRRDGGGDWINLPGAATQGNTWTDVTALSGHTYTYSVWCYTEAYKTAEKSVRARYRSRYKDNQPSVLFLATTQLSSGSVVNGDSVLLTWGAVDGAASYRVLYAVSTGDENEEEWTTLAEGVTDTQWTHTSPVPGKSNLYAVQPVAADGTEGFVSALMSVDCPALPQLVSAASEGAGVRVNWKKYDGAAKYRVLCRVGSGSWKKVADTTSTTALVKTSDGKNALKTGKTYAFTVRCLTADGKSYTTGCDEQGVSAVYVCAPTLSSVTNVKKQKLNVAWKKVSGATGYQVQSALNSSFTSGKKTANRKGAGSLKHTFTALKKKKTCYVRVRTYKTVNGKSYWSTWSKVKKVTIKK